MAGTLGLRSSSSGEARRSFAKAAAPRVSLCRQAWYRPPADMRRYGKMKSEENLGDTDRVWVGGIGFSVRSE